jgi:CBS domain containing-hemolysin-like protein
MLRIFVTEEDLLGSVLGVPARDRLFSSTFVSKQDALDGLESSQVALAVVSAMAGSVFAAADASLSTMAEAQLTALASKEPNSFGRFEKDPRRVLSRWLVARILTISFATATLHRVAVARAGSQLGVVIAVAAAIVTYGTSAEVLGALARRRPERFARWALTWLRPVEWAIEPLAAPLAALGRLVDRNVPEDREITPEHEVEWAVSQGEREGTIAKEPAEMIRNVLDFKDVVAQEVMVPRRKISGIELSMPLDRVLAFVASEGHSRFPVYRENLDLYAKDLFDIVQKKTTETAKLTDVLRSNVLFVTETQGASNILREMRSRRLHMAIVTDDSGGTSGLVTLEDLIEEIVGEINDEHDLETDMQILKIAEGRYVVDAAVSLADLEPYIGALPEGDFESLGGLLVAHAGRVPSRGTQMSFHGYRFVVREADQKRVIRVEILKREPTLEPPTEDAGARASEA